MVVLATNTCFLGSMADNLDSLERLAGLYERGILTAPEFEAQKARLLQSYEQEQGHPELLHTSGRSLGYLPSTKMAIVATVGSLTLIALALWYYQSRGDQKKLPVSAQMRTQANALSGDEIGFDDASQCVPSASFEAIIDDLKDAADRVGDRAVQLPVRFKSGVEVRAQTGVSNATRVRTSIASVPLSGSWKKLSLIQLKASRWPTGSGFQLSFREPARKAKALLADAGFKVGKVGELVNREGTLIGLEDLNTGSALTCLTSANDPDSSEFDAPSFKAK